MYKGAEVEIFVGWNINTLRKKVQKNYQHKYFFHERLIMVTEVHILCDVRSGNWEFWSFLYF